MAKRRTKARSGSGGMRGAAWRAAAALAGVAIVAAGWWAFRARARRAAPSDPIATMSPADAYAAAVESTLAGRHLESLPLYRHAERAAPSELRVLHWNFASALYRAGFESGPGGGLAVRSSIERVALMREALGEMQRAIPLPGTPDEKGASLEEFASMLHLWGFPWEAFSLYREAEAAEPARTEYAARANKFRELLEFPDKTVLRGVGEPPR